VDREKLYNAVLAEVQTLQAPPNLLGIEVVSREFKHWDDAPQQPAIYIVQVAEAGEYQRGVPIKWTVSIELWLYARKDGDVLGVMKLNPILDALEKKFNPTGPPQNYVNTLNGVVQRCAISGTIEISGGWLGEQAVAMVPLVIVTA
jgi:hypothetical protein